MVIDSFRLVTPQRIVFGRRSADQLGELIGDRYRSVAILTGRRSLQEAGGLARIEKSLNAKSVSFRHFAVDHEPTPRLVDNIAEELRSTEVDMVVSIGGGSVLDAGKAVSAMIPQQDSVRDYLEGVGGRTFDGRKIPFIAVPTTAGTGSEATMNAVISEVGLGGFKASLRHENLVPDIALVDPELMLTCPASVTAACGMDAFTQLLESYVSPKASPITDALALSGIEKLRTSLIHVCTSGAGDIEARSSVAYAAMLSGITLANAGLGVVHGVAGLLGGLFDIPHGVACGTLVAGATRKTIEKLEDSDSIALAKYETVGRIIGGGADDGGSGCEMLINTLERWTSDLKIPRLGQYGIGREHLDKVAARAGNKNNPAKLNAKELSELLAERL